MLKTDLNSDLGESFGAYKIGDDENVLGCVSSANIACGFHAGDPCVLRKTVALAKKAGVAIGAHPGYPDLVGFGRRNMSVSPQDMHDYTLYQLGAFAAFAKAEGMEVQHLKPHGAMYNMAAKDINLSLAICRAIKEYSGDIIFMGLAGSCMEQAAKELNIKWAGEAFADRAYTDEGTLVPRGTPGAMIEDEDLAVARVIAMIKTGKVKSITGKDITIGASTVCVHGDSPKALAFAKKIRAALENESIAVTPLNKMI